MFCAVICPSAILPAPRVPETYPTLTLVIERLNPLEGGFHRASGGVVENAVQGAIPATALVAYIIFPLTADS